jgi:hypothetical protein
MRLSGPHFIDEQPEESSFDCIDIDQLLVIFRALNWRWAGVPPSRQDVVRVCQELLKELSNDETLASIESGGLKAWRDEWEALHVGIEMDLKVIDVPAAESPSRTVRHH